MKDIIAALEKIDDIVSGDYGFEADCYLGLPGQKDKEIDRETARIWAKMITDIYRITHPLFGECCGGKHPMAKKFGKKRKEIDKKLLKELSC